MIWGQTLTVALVLTKTLYRLTAVTKRKKWILSRVKTSMILLMSSTLTLTIVWSLMKKQKQLTREPHQSMPNLRMSWLSVSIARIWSTRTQCKGQTVQPELATGCPELPSLSANSSKSELSCPWTSQNNYLRKGVWKTKVMLLKPRIRFRAKNHPCQMPITSRPQLTLLAHHRSTYASVTLKDSWQNPTTRRTLILESNSNRRDTNPKEFASSRISQR